MRAAKPGEYPGLILSGASNRDLKIGVLRRRTYKKNAPPLSGIGAQGDLKKDHVGGIPGRPLAAAVPERIGYSG